MVKRDVVDDLVDVLYPWPDRPVPMLGPDGDLGDADELADEEANDAARYDVEQERQAFAENLRAAQDADDDVYDPFDALINELRRARQERDHASARIRMLIAYGREFTAQPYKLGTLAQAGGLSISGVRTVYSPTDIDEVSRRIGRPARPR
jgi:hypothetical protein